MKGQSSIPIIIILIVLTAIGGIYYATKEKQTITTIKTTITSTTLQPTTTILTTTQQTTITTTSSTTTTIGLISEQNALNLANNAVQSKCGITYTQIEKLPWSKGGPTWDFFITICPDLEDYNYSEAWRAGKYLNEIECSPIIKTNCIEIVTFIGIHVEFVCSYGLYRAAAPGVTKLENVC